MSDRVAAKKDLKRQRILDIAKRRLGRFGIRATTMQDIARDADVAVGTIYQFFPDKDALVLAWFDEHAHLIRSQWEEVLALPIPADEKLRRIVQVRFRTERQMREEPAVMEIARAVSRLAPDAVRDIVASVHANLRAVLEEGRTSGVMPSADPEIDVEIFSHALSGFFQVVEDPIHGPPSEEAILRVVDWFISKWKLKRPRTRT